MADHTYRMNRAVGIMNKGDTFVACTDDDMVVSLLGAGYLDDLGEVPRGDTVPGGPGSDAAGARPVDDAPRPPDSEPDRDSGEEDRSVRLRSTPEPHGSPPTDLD